MGNSIVFTLPAFQDEVILLLETIANMYNIKVV